MRRLTLLRSWLAFATGAGVAGVAIPRTRRRGLALALAAVFVAPLSCESPRTRDTTILYDAITAEYAAQDAILCPCEVADGAYASLAACEARHAITEEQRTCIHGILKAHQDRVVESLWCTLDAEEAFSDCVEEAACTSDGRLDCAIAHTRDLEPCGLPGEVVATIEVECFGEPPLACADGQILVEEMLCDGKADCADKSDERDCPGRYLCADGMSVPEGWACDGEADCEDRSDETNCGGFTCGDGTPIPGDWRCDGEADCADGADEKNC